MLSHVVKQVAITLWKGLGLSHISLPIKIFEPTSTLMRIADLWTSAPLYLKKAAKLTDHVERLKLIITFSVSNIYLCCSQLKPFNPLLGETMQGEFPDGTKFYLEHTSHHPPVANFLVEDADGGYRLSGYLEVVGKMGANSLTSGLRGPCDIVFKDGHHVRFGVPFYRLGGTLYGDRTIEVVGSNTFEDFTNNRKAVLIFNSFKKTGFFYRSASGNRDEVQGIIYDCSVPLKND